MGRYWPYLVLLLPPLFWAGNFIVGRAFSAELGAITMSFYRWLLALCLLAPFAYSRVRQELPIILNHLPILTVLGRTNPSTAHQSAILRVSRSSPTL